MSSSRFDLAMTWIVFALALGAFGYVFSVNVLVLTLRAPQEYRESAIILGTDLLVHGGNPYALANQPTYTDIYGIGYHVLVYPLARLWGSTLFIHRLVSMLMTLACCGLLFGAVRGAGCDSRLAFAAAALLYCDLASRTSTYMDAMPMTILSRPDGLALLFFLASICWPLRKQFTPASLVASAMFGICALLTKPYLAFGPIVIAAYLFLFVSKQKGLILGIGMLFLASAAIIGATLVMPCYAANVITGTRSSASHGIPSHLYTQLGIYAMDAPGIVILGIFALAKEASKIKSALSDDQRGPNPTLNLRQVSKPLLPQRAGFAAFATAFIFIVMFAKLGRFPGNTMIYFYHLLSPMLILAGFSFIAHAQKRGMWMALIALDLLLFPLSAGRPPAAHADVWRKWDNLLASHERVYAPPPLVPILLQQRKAVYDGGISYCFMYSMENPIYPRESVLRAQYDRFLADLARNTLNQQFDLIVLPYRGDQPELHFLPTDLVAQNYQPVGRLEMPMDWQPGWNGVIWERKTFTAPK